MNTTSTAKLAPTVIGVVIAVAIVVAAVAVVMIDPWGQQGSGLSDRWQYDLDEFKQVDPALIRFDQQAEIALPLERPKAVAVGRDDHLFVVGDQRLMAFDTDGGERLSVELEDTPYCIAVGGDEHAHPGRIYVGFEQHVEAYSATGKRVARWPAASERSVLTSIALGEQDVFVADAGDRVVLRYDVDGKLLGEIGRKDDQRGIPGFVIPSPYFDVLMAPDGLLRVVNPGEHRVEAYTVDGDLELHWGEPSLDIKGFCGCCNPVNLAQLGDGRFVTAEKGVPRVKIYDAEGAFQSVVAGPSVLLPTDSAAEETRTEHKLLAVDVAVDSNQRVLVLDPARRTIRVFQEKP